MRRFPSMCVKAREGKGFDWKFNGMTAMYIPPPVLPDSPLNRNRFPLHSAL